MDRREVEKKVVGTIQSVIGGERSNIIPSASIVEDLHGDSLDEIEIMMALEDEFSIDIPDERADKLKTVKDIVDYVYATET